MTEVVSAMSAIDACDRPSCGTMKETGPWPYGASVCTHARVSASFGLEAF